MKKRGRRHKLLSHKLSLSEGESGEEKAASKEKKKGGKKKSGKKGCEICLKIGVKYCLEIGAMTFAILFYVRGQ